MTPAAEQRDAGDGAVPRLWLYAALLSAVLAAGTWLAHEGFHVAPGALDAYLAERTAALDRGTLVTDAMLTELSTDPLALRAGAAAFAEHCARCHGARAQGNVGPNLTDGYWLGGGAPLAIYTSIVEGRAAGGMQPWGSLGRGLCKQLTAYLLTLRDTDVAGKPPQGSPWPPAN